MQVTLKTWNKLQSEGWKSSYPRCYLGSEREPRAAFRYAWMDAYLGKKATIIRCPNKTTGEVDIRVGKDTIEGVHIWLFEEKVDISKLTNPTLKKFSFSRKRAKFYKTIGFVFPCEFDELKPDDAREVAKWILKVTS